MCGGPPGKGAGFSLGSLWHVILTATLERTLIGKIKQGVKRQAQAILW